MLKKIFLGLSVVFLVTSCPHFLSAQEEQNKNYNLEEKHDRWIRQPPQKSSTNPYEQCSIESSLREKEGRSQFSLILKAEKEIYKVGEEIRIVVTWRNITDKEVSISGYQCNDEPFELFALYGFDVCDVKTKKFLYYPYLSKACRKHTKKTIILKPNEAYEICITADNIRVVRIPVDDAILPLKTGEYIIRLNKYDVLYYAQPVNAIKIKVIK